MKELDAEDLHGTLTCWLDGRVFVAACIAGYFPYGALVLRERLDARQAAGLVLGISGILLGCL